MLNLNLLIIFVTVNFSCTYSKKVALPFKRFLGIQSCEKFARSFPLCRLAFQLSFKVTEVVRITGLFRPDRRLVSIVPVNSDITYIFARKC